MRSLLLAILLIAAGCVQPALDPDPVPEAGAEAISFIVVGDTGTGTAVQKRVADAMEDVCIEIGCDFALLLGDAIYETGVSSANDPQFQTKFELPYHNLTIPFYVVMGNHDYGGNGRGYDSAKAQYNLEYSAKSTRWNMPGVTYVVDTGPIDLFALDSGSLVVHGSPTVPPGSSLAEQRAWLTQAIAASDAPWKMTFAHHPYISNGQHGDAGSYDGVSGLGNGWKELLETTACDRVDFHLAGHDHDLQWLKPVKACGDTEFLISGAGAKQRSAGTGMHPARFQAYSTYGFMWIQATDDRLVVRAYDDAGTVLIQSVRSVP